MARFDFKAGDKVRFRPELEVASFGRSDEFLNTSKNAVGEVISIDSDDDLLVHYSDGRFNNVLTSPGDVIRVPGKKGKPPTDSAESWNFHSASHLDVDYEEILDSLTRKNPIALIERGDHYSVAIKVSLINKANVCNLPKPSNNGWAHRTERGTVFRCKHTDFHTWVAWAKATKKAKWPSTYHYNATVKIYTPTI